jgi:Zn-dependent peptidase ImmA (M78 family)
LVARGFKTWCETIASDRRQGLGVVATAPLPIRRLAAQMNIRVWYPKDIPQISQLLLRAIQRIEEGAWSAATLVHRGKHLVILNDKHPLGRQNNDLAHEVSHVICGHEPSQTQVLANNLMVVTEYDGDQEEEADLLAATLLLPRVALLAIMEAALSLDVAAERYGVSEELLKMRLQRAGVYLQFRRRGGSKPLFAR